MRISNLCHLSHFNNTFMSYDSFCEFQRWRPSWKPKNSTECTKPTTYAYQKIAFFMLISKKYMTWPFQGHWRSKKWGKSQILVKNRKKPTWITKHPDQAYQKIAFFMLISKRYMTWPFQGHWRSKKWCQSEILVKNRNFHQGLPNTQVRHTKRLHFLYLFQKCIWIDFFDRLKSKPAG